MRNWTLREMLLLVTVLAFVLFLVSDAVRSRIAPFQRFELTYSDVVNWAKEVDSKAIPSDATGGGSRSQDPHGGRSDLFIGLELEVSAAKVPEILQNYRRRITEKIDREGWTKSVHGTDPFQISLRKLGSLFDVYFFTATTPIPVNELNGGEDKVRLTIHWIIIGYTTTRDGMGLANPAPTAP